MNLENKLHEIKGGTILKIGSNHSSGFIHCYYLNDLTIERIDNESKNYLAYLKRRLYRKKTSLKKLPTDKEKALQKELKKCENHEERYKVFEKNEILFKKREKSLIKNIDSLTKQIARFTPYLTRKVIKAYSSDEVYEPNTLIIIIEGSEKGDYWNIDEYAQSKGYRVLTEDRHKEYCNKENKNENN